MKVRAIIGTICATVVLTTSVIASTPYTLLQSSGAVEAISMFITSHTRKGLIEWYKTSLRCDKPGEMIYKIEGQTKYGTLCGVDGMINAVGAGVNYGHIERLKSVGVPIEWLRTEFADPTTLRAAYRIIGSATIAEVVRMSIRGPYAQLFVYGDSDNESSKIDHSQLSVNAHEYLVGFVKRRVAEAKSKDRREIAELWGEIINAQVDLFLVDQAVIPEIRRRRK